MNTKFKSIFKTITLSLGALLLVTTATYAIGTLTPSGTPGDDTQYSLNDIYAKLIDFSDTATEGTGASTTPGSVEATFRTLSEIYTLLEAEDADLVPENIADGVTVFGVEGTAELASELEWSTEQGSMDWDTAVSTCAGTVDGSTGWRLPTILELLAAISDDWLIDGSGSRFVYNTSYWSGTENGSIVWFAGWLDVVGNNAVDKSNEFSVRCVR